MGDVECEIWPVQNGSTHEYSKAKTIVSFPQTMSQFSGIVQ